MEFRNYYRHICCTYLVEFHDIDKFIEKCYHNISEFHDFETAEKRLF